MKVSNNPTAKNDRRIVARYNLSLKPQPTDVDKKELEVLNAKIVAPEVARASRSKIYRGPK